MPIIERRAEIIRWCIYDTFKATPKMEMLNEETYILFSLDSSVWRKTKQDTNMIMSQILPMPQHLNVTHSQIAFGACNSEKDNKTFQDNVRYEFYIGNKIYDEGPISRYHTLSTNIEYQKFLEDIEVAKQQDAKIVGNYIDYRLGNDTIGHHILQGQNFNVRLIFQPMVFNSNFKFIYFLEGVISRAVQ